MSTLVLVQLYLYDTDITTLDIFLALVFIYFFVEKLPI